jgi:uncharacterized membrane protein HdeD (DUF308 family)
MEMRFTDPANAELNQQVRASAGWGIAIGIILLVLGFIAIARPLYATIASTWVFGWLFIAAGAAQIVYAFRSYGVGQLIWKVLLGLLYLIAGIYIVSNPISGATALTLALGITIFAQGVIQVILAFQMRSSSSWWAVLVSGIVAVILGIFIWSRFPYSADWLIGLWVGIHLLFSGASILVISSTIRVVLR